MSNLEITSDEINADQLVQFLLDSGAETGDLDLSGSDIRNVGNLDAENVSSGGLQTSRDADVTFYVDQANGDDANDGKSAASAFASYPRALEEAPRFADSRVQIRQIGDYSTPTNTPLKITNRSGAIYQNGYFSLEILGDSQLDPLNGNGPTDMETFDGNIHIEGCTGINIKNLNWDGEPFVMSSSGITVYNCYMEGFSFHFAYLRSGEVNLIYNVYDGQSNDPNTGFSCLRNGRMQIEGGEIRNWDYQNNVAYQAFNGGKIIDGFDDKYPDANRSGDIVPSDGRGISDEAFDRDLDGKDLTDGSSTVYDGSNSYVPQSVLERDSLTLTGGDGLKGGGTVALGGSTTINIEPSDFAGALLSDDGSDNLAVDESDIDHNNIDQTTVSPDDHHAQDHQSRHGFGEADELATALRYEPQSEPSTPSSGMVRWYDETDDAFKVKFDDGSIVTQAEK